MPTKYKAQLNHFPYKWDDELKRELQAISPTIVRASGLEKLLSGSPDGIVDGPDEHELICRIDGILSLAAAVRIESDTAVANKVIATLQAVERTPPLVRSNTIEPEALSMLQRHYQRSDEVPGTYWTDFDHPELVKTITFSAIKQAARLAITTLKREAKNGRPSDPLLADVGRKLAEIFLYYNPDIARTSRLSSRSGKLIQVEDGPFLDFACVVLGPLNRYLSFHPAKPRLLIPAQVVRAYLDHTHGRRAS